MEPLPGETSSGTPVVVACTDSRVNKGSEEVTCKTGQEWTFAVAPECVYRKLHLHLYNLQV